MSETQDDPLITVTPVGTEHFFAQLAAGPRRITRIASVSPVAFRTVLSLMPAPDGSPAGVADAEDAVSAAVAQMAKPFRIAWEYATAIKRSDLVALGPQVGWDETAIDAVLAQAASLLDSGAAYEEIEVYPA